MYPNIKAEMARKNITQDELVKKLGVCRKTFYSWNKHGNIPLSKLEQMATIFGCTVDYLLKS